MGRDNEKELGKVLGEPGLKKVSDLRNNVGEVNPISIK